jgi:hypothetical protein
VKKFVGSRGAPIVAGLRLPVFLRGAGRAKEESGRPTWWPCDRRCQRQPADCRCLPVAPHRATGKQDNRLSSFPHVDGLLSVPEFRAPPDGLSGRAGRGAPKCLTVRIFL